MPSQLMHKVESLIIGIRFARSFRIPDISGEIADEILYGEKTPFGPDFFPNLKDYSDEKFLVNNENGNFFRINSDEIILRVGVKNFENEFACLLEKQVPFMVDKIISKNKIKNITRIGMVFRHKFDGYSVLKELVTEFTKEKIQDPNNVDFSFAKKIDAKNSNLSGIEDYINTIFGFSKTENHMLADLDYQKYFIPMREDIRDTKIDEFINDARKYVVNDFHPLLRKYYEEA